MPPWLPEPGYGDFADVRRLTDRELGLIQQWIAEGATEGDARDARPAPAWNDDWPLGQPDLVVKAEKPYLLASEGKDVYRNLVLPVRIPARRYIKAVEFKPGNARVVHHASINLDPTPESRRRAQKQDPPGFDGMTLPESATVVAGQLLGWEPGKIPTIAGPGMAWALEPNTDLVIQLHLHPSGKGEDVQPAVGFYFTDEPPTKMPYLLRLPEWRIDIPAGAADYPVDNSFVLPVDVEVLQVSPHAHYLAKEMQGYALLPDGTRQWLLWIKNWDFNWQGDYRYAKPVFLPRGTKLVMHFTYDNSTNNIRNPNLPPRRVRSGPQTTDEMAQLCFQVLPRSAEERTRLSNESLKKLTLDAIAYNESLLKENPRDATAHAKIGQALLPLGRLREAADHLQESIRLNPRDDKPRYDLGLLFLLGNQLAEAEIQFRAVLELNPEDSQAHGSLGTIYLRQGNLDLAERHSQAALGLNPGDTIARANLNAILTAKRGQK